MTSNDDRRSNRQLGWGLGTVLLPLVAWLVRDSFWIQIVITLPCLMVLALHWIPESPLWLLQNGRGSEAEKILLTAAKMNGVKPSEELIEALKLLMTKGTEAYKSSGRKGNIFDLFKSPGLWQITINVYFNWFVICFVYYGLSINTNELAGDPFINFTLMAAVEIPAVLLTMLVLGSVGKKKLLTSSMITCGIACFASCFQNLDMWWLAATISSIGKFSVYVAYAVFCVFTNEIFPTVVRNSGMGSALFCGSLGSMLAPFTRELGIATHPIFPQIIFGALAIASGFLVCLLPENKSHSVPDTMEEAVGICRWKSSMSLKEVKGNNSTVRMTDIEVNNEQDANNLV